MDILLESRAFYPSVGGLEMMSRGLARTWQEKGHSVRIVTVTRLANEEEIDELDVHRLPSSGEMRQHVQWADVFIQNGISLRSLHWPVLTGTPLVMVHQNLQEGAESPLIRTQLRRMATFLGSNIVISTPVEDTIPGPSVRIPNTFRPIYDQIGEQSERGAEKRKGLLFVGRLVSVKGVDVAIEALRYLHARGREISLTICGDGPERGGLENQVKQAGLETSVTFEGWTSPERLAELYRRAEALLVPSRYEPFGIVALEAIASGCPVVASETGGLPEAVGACGMLVEPDAPGALAAAIDELLDPAVVRKIRSEMPAHVERHRMDRVATDYLHLLRRVVR